MVRFLAYNILLGGAPRVDQLTSIIRASGADVIGLAEATNPRVVRTLAERLGMHFCLTGEGKRERDWQVALLSRLPILETRVHSYPEIFTRQHFLEVHLEDPAGTTITAFVTHLTASFHTLGEGDRKRRGEVRQLLEAMQACRGKPHLVMGDFNSATPGDPLYASTIIRNGMRLRARQHEAALKHGTPQLHPQTRRERFFDTTLKVMLSTRTGTTLIDRLSPIYTHGGISLLLKTGYTDCYRVQHPASTGFTFPSNEPACRIDYIFASPELASRLEQCEVIKEGEGVKAEIASDHLPLYADFR